MGKIAEKSDGIDEKIEKDDVKEKTKGKKTKKTQNTKVKKKVEEKLKIIDDEEDTEELKIIDDEEDIEELKIIDVENDKEKVKIVSDKNDKDSKKSDSKVDEKKDTKVRKNKKTKSVKKVEKTKVEDEKLKIIDEDVEEEEKLKIIDEEEDTIISDKEQNLVNENDEIDNDIVDEDDESKYDTVSLKQIRDALENKVNKDQKKSIITQVLFNIGIGILMIVVLSLIIIGSKKIGLDILEKSIKITALVILLLGIGMLEISYKKDKTKLLINAVEILLFGAINISIIYILKLYVGNLMNISMWVGSCIIGYYILKSCVITSLNIRKYKKDNSDIKEIVKKNKRAN